MTPPISPEPPRDDEDEVSSGPETHSSVACPRCSSLYTRPSRSHSNFLVALFRGNLYRCRDCKSHFRVQDTRHAGILSGMVILVAMVAVLLPILVDSSVWERLIPSLPFLRGATVQELDAAGLPRNPDSDELAVDLRALYREAQTYDRQFPEVEAAYRDLAEQYKQWGVKEAGKPRASLSPEQEQVVSARFAKNFRQGHAMLVNLVGSYRQKVASAQQRAGKRLQNCTEAKARQSITAAQRQYCDALPSALSSLGSVSRLIEEDFSKSEQIYAQCGQEINRVAVQTTGRQIVY